jgi:hypothetical protein
MTSTWTWPRYIELGHTSSTIKQRQGRGNGNGNGHGGFDLRGSLASKWLGSINQSINQYINQSIN